MTVLYSAMYTTSNVQFQDGATPDTKLSHSQAGVLKSMAPLADAYIVCLLRSFTDCSFFRRWRVDP